MIKERLHRLRGTEVMLQYRRKAFSMTEVEYAREISGGRHGRVQPTPQRKMILNLPDTVEVAMPMFMPTKSNGCAATSKTAIRSSSVWHTHNDRLHRVAATELACSAGADRVEELCLAMANAREIWTL